MILRELIAKFGLEFDKKSFKEADHAISELKESAEHLIEALAVMEIGEKLYELVEGTIHAGANIAIMAAKVGVGTDALQELQYAAEQSGISVEDFNKSFTLFGRTVGMAANGDEGAVKKFAELGIAVHDAGGRVKDSEILFDEVADKIKNAKSQAQRLAIAADLFGAKGGTKFAVALKNGASGVEALREEARELGGVMSEDMIEKAEDTHRAINKVNFAVSGLKNIIVGALMPSIAEGAEGFIEWIKLNRALIKQRLEFYVSKIATGVKSVVSGVIFAIKIFTAFTAIIGGVENAVIALAIGLAVSLVASIGEAIAGFSALNLTLLITKAAMLADAFIMGAIFLGLAAIIGLVGEEIESLFDDKKQGLFKSFAGKWGDLSDSLLETARTSKSAWGAILSFIGAVITQMVSMIDRFFASIFNQLSMIYDFQESVVDAIELAPTRLMTASRNFFKFLDSETPDWVKSIGGTISGVVSGSVSPSAAVSNAARGAGNTIYQTISAPIDASGQSLDESKVADLVSQHIANAMTTANAVALQALTPSVAGTQ